MNGDTGSSSSLRVLQTREYEWTYTDAFPNADAKTRAKLEVMDELRAQLHRDDSLVPIDDHVRYCLYACQLAQTLFIDRSIKSAIPELWFHNGSKACNCIWFEVVCQTLDVARRAFMQTFEHDRLPNIVAPEKRRQLCARYCVVLSMLQFVDQWVYKHWKGHSRVLQFMRGYQKDSCRDLVHLIGAYVAWCMNLLNRQHEQYDGLSAVVQENCKDLSIASCVLLSKVYTIESYDFHTINEQMRSVRGGSIGSEPDAAGAAATSDKKQESYERANPFHRGNGSDTFLNFSCEPTTAKMRRKIARELPGGKLRYHYVFEKSMGLADPSIGLHSSALAMSATGVSGFDAPDHKVMLAFNAATMRYATWVEACLVLSIVDLADYYFANSDVGTAVALYECAAHNGCYLPRLEQLVFFRKSLRSHQLPATVEHVLRRAMEKVPRVFRGFMKNALNDVVIDENTQFIVDNKTQSTAADVDSSTRSSVPPDTPRTHEPDQHDDQEDNDIASER